MLRIGQYMSGQLYAPSTITSSKAPMTGEEIQFFVCGRLSTMP